MSSLYSGGYYKDKSRQDISENSLNIYDLASCQDSWRLFLEYKIDHQHLSAIEKASIENFIECKAYLPLSEAFKSGSFPESLPIRRTVNKQGSRKKRIVYSFEGDEGIFLKFIAFNLFCYDGFFSKNCYAFRRGYGARDALQRLRRDPSIPKKYCLKVDISNYFNSIDVNILLEKLNFVQQDDPMLYNMFRRILSEKRVRTDNTHHASKGAFESNDTNIIIDEHGAMAGTPISPFFANVYLSELDYLFEEMNVTYMRYSDDILMFADTQSELNEYFDILKSKLSKLHLELNPDKVKISAPGEPFEFLGFSYCNREIDLSANTIRKMKGKIKRKAEALRRWQRAKGVSGDKATIGFIRAMNRKFYGKSANIHSFNCSDPSGSFDSAVTEFTWNRWFFPCLTVDAGLKEIDTYMQEYIRYTVTGRHYKGNYRIKYEQLKDWGYRSLVHEYYQAREKHC